MAIQALPYKKVNLFRKKSVPFLPLSGAKIFFFRIVFFTWNNYLFTKVILGLFCLSFFCYKRFLLIILWSLIYCILNWDYRFYFDSFWIFMISNMVNPGGNHSYLLILSWTKWTNLRNFLQSMNQKNPQMGYPSIILFCFWSSSKCVLVFWGKFHCSFEYCHCISLFCKINPSLPNF